MKKKIETFKEEFVDFDVIDFKGNVGDEVWLKQYNQGDTAYYVHGIIKGLAPDDWWIYDNEDGTTNPRLGHASVLFDGDSCETMIPYAELLLKDPVTYSEQNSETLESELQQLSTEDLIQIMNKLDDISFTEDDILRVWHKKYFSAIDFSIFIAINMWKALTFEFARRLTEKRN